MAQTNNRLPGWPVIFNIFELFPPFDDYQFFETSQKFPFEHQAKGHNEVNAWWLAELASLAYHDEAGVRKILTRLLNIADRDIQWLAQDGTDGFMIDYQGDYFIVFRGTEFYKPDSVTLSSVPRTIMDIQTDLGFTTMRVNEEEDNPVSGVNIHGGFNCALEAVWQQINEFVQQDPDKKIWLTGHSLGGALATVAAMRLHKRVKGLYSYGCPGVGDETLVRFFDDNLADKAFRYVNGNDLVTRALTVAPFANFSHVGEEQMIDIKQSASIFDFLWDGFNIGLRDHSPLYYMHGTRVLMH